MGWAFPYWEPPLTSGPYVPPSGSAPGPGGPLPDPRATMLAAPNPWAGRAVNPLMAFGPTVGVFAPWAGAPINNAYATRLLDMYVPGWLKPPGYTGF